MIPTSKLPAKLPMGQLDIFIKREKKHNIIHPLFFHFAKCQTPCDRSGKLLSWSLLCLLDGGAGLRRDGRVCGNQDTMGVSLVKDFKTP